MKVENQKLERVQENIYLGQKIVFGRENQTVEIQRRLISMNEFLVFGLVSHWITSTSLSTVNAPLELPKAIWEPLSLNSIKLDG